MTTMTSPMSRLDAKRAQERQYRLVAWIAFLFLLPITALARLAPRVWRNRLLGPVPRTSIVREAWTRAHITVGFAFGG